MKLLLVAQKSLLEFLREAQLLALTLALPLIFLGITAAGYTTPMLVTHQVAVINQAAESGEALITGLQAERYPNGKPVFDLGLTQDRPAADIALKEQRLTALLVISTGEAGKLVAEITGDALYAPFYRASPLLDNAIFRYADEAAGVPEVVRVETQSISAGQPQSEFDLYAPGIIIFALLLLIPQTAMLVAREVRWRTLRRLRLTPLSAGEFLGGIGLAQMIVAIFQVALIIVGAMLMGFHNQGSAGLAIIVGLAVSFSAVGLGLMTACFVENDSQAANAGSSITMLQVFLSGSFFQLPPLTVFTLVGHQIDLFDIFPATHGFLALQQVLSYGAGLQDVAFRLGATLVLSLGYLAFGVWLFNRMKMKTR